MRVVGLVLCALVLPLLTAAQASAQVFGTFPWQLQPYCHVVTLTLSHSPAGFVLEGTDNQCGAANKASAVGIASFNASGNVTMNFSIVTAPSGRPVHVSAVVNPGTGSGTWTDSVGNTGTMVLAGAVPGLPARPMPASGLAAAVVTSTELAANAVTGAKVADGSLTSADLADGPRAEAAAGNQNQTISTSPSPMRSLTITAPTAGKVVVYASGYFSFTVVPTALESVQCSISDTTGIDSGAIIRATDGGSTNAAYATPFSGVRMFTVPAGPFTVHLNCQVLAGNVVMGDSGLAAIFVPQ